MKKTFKIVLYLFIFPTFVAVIFSFIKLIQMYNSLENYTVVYCLIFAMAYILATLFYIGTMVYGSDSFWKTQKELEEKRDLYLKEIDKLEKLQNTYIEHFEKKFKK